MLTYTQIRAWAAEHFHEDPADTALTNLFIRWTNQGLNQIASTSSWKWLEGIRQFTMGGDGAGVNTAGGITYFPHYVHRILGLWPTARGYRQPIQIVGGWELDAVSPGVTLNDRGVASTTRCVTWSNEVTTRNSSVPEPESITLTWSKYEASPLTVKIRFGSAASGATTDRVCLSVSARATW